MFTLTINFYKYLARMGGEDKPFSVSILYFNTRVRSEIIAGYQQLWRVLGFFSTAFLYHNLHVWFFHPWNNEGTTCNFCNSWMSCCCFLLSYGKVLQESRGPDNEAVIRTQLPGTDYPPFIKPLHDSRYCSPYIQLSKHIFRLQLDICEEHLSV